MSDKFEIVIDKLNSLNLDLQIVKNNVEHIKYDVAKNTIDLEKHIEGVLTAKSRLDIEAKRSDLFECEMAEIAEKVCKMERLHIFISVGLKVLGGLGVIAAILRFVFGLI